MRLGTWSLVGLLAMLMCAPITAAQEGPDLVLEGTEGPDCLPDGLDCFLVASGDLDQVFVAGQPVTVALEAVGNAPHNVYVTTPDEADPDRLDTPASAAFANSETVDPGENTTVTFVVPADAEELYLWCDVGQHEASGMWLIAEVQDPPGPDGNATEEDAGEEEAGGDGTEEENGTPLPAWAALAGLLVATLVVRGRR